MKVLKVSHKNRELGRVALTQPTMLLGRSPFCDLVLRKKGIQPVHFIIEWIGAGEFSMDQGKWTIFQVLEQTSDEKVEDLGSGEGIILSDKNYTVDDLEFALVEDKLMESQFKSGFISDELTKNNSVSLLKQNKPVLEVVCLNSDSQSVKEVYHYNAHLKNELVVKELNHMPIQCLNTSSGFSAKMNMSHIPGAKAYQKGKLILDSHQQVKTEVKIDNHDFVHIHWKMQDYYFRFVPYIRAPKDQSSILTSRFAMTIIISCILVFLLLFIIKTGDFKKTIEIQEPPRIAKIEIQDLTVKPIPPEILPPKPEPEPVQTDLPLPKEALKQNTEAPKAVAKFEGKKTIPENNKGLNAPVKQDNVNAVGLLGALKNKKANTVSADQVMNNALVSDTVSGANAQFVVNQSPSGVIGKKQNTQNSNGLTAASTTLNQADSISGSQAGALVGTGGRKVGDSAQIGLKGSTDNISMDGADSVLGGLDKESVRRTLKAYGREIRTCYERALTAKSKLAGRISYKWGIAPAGNVTYVNLVSSEVGSPKLESCVQDVIKTIQFPIAQNGQSTTVIYPFVFQSKN